MSNCVCAGVWWPLRPHERDVVHERGADFLSLALSLSLFCGDDRDLTNEHKTSLPEVYVLCNRIAWKFNSSFVYIARHFALSSCTRSLLSVAYRKKHVQDTFFLYPLTLDVVLQCVAVCYSVLRCGAVCCSLLQCVAVTVCFNVLHPLSTDNLNKCQTFWGACTF